MSVEGPSGRIGVSDRGDAAVPRSLEHPLPAGMRDLLPEEAAARRTMARKLLDQLALYGYALVTPPVFEFAEVLERGLGTLDPTHVLRFVEPESGEVAALRPDMTPQIARMVATRLRERPSPHRLGYEGTVLRRRTGRARKHRQIPQVGVELAGVAGPEGDLELLSLAADALRAAGLLAFTIDLGDAGVVRALLGDLPADGQARLSEALGRKDEAAIEDAAARTGSRYAEVLRALPGLHGGRDVLASGARRVAATPAAPAAERLLALFDAAVARGLGPHLVGDLGEVRGFEYYTGTIFHVYAPGTGDAVVSGGRYDDLLARFGHPLPAAGFAVDLDRLGEALRAAGSQPETPVRVVVVGPADDPRVADLRARGVVAVALIDRRAALAWARAWEFTHVLDGTGWLDARTEAGTSSPFGERGQQ
ncbi:MAG: ATP phosphoribosyltransferase regulatory subunit [Myxococcales bacterium]|nr:ATP phosphoribosyltransferase regulatory subunit [Myxococcales bacterium]